jgi:TonB-dependent receptor
VRPARTEVSPLTQVTLNEGNGSGTTYTIDGVGNKTIQPYTARSYDAAIEWYNRSGSVIALNAYRKSLKGQIYDITFDSDPDRACPADGIFDGVDYGIGPLQRTGSTTLSQRCEVVNRPINSITGIAQPTYLVLGNQGRNKRNNTNTIQLNGIELSVQQNLSFLPFPWNNLGGSANYSRTTYNGTLPNGNKVLIANTAKNNYNLVGYYDQGSFNFRLIFNKRGSALQSEDTSQPWNNVSTKPRTQIDLSTSWKFKSGMQVSLDIVNLTNALVQQYRGDPRMIQTIAFDGRTATVALRAPF